MKTKSGSVFLNWAFLTILVLVWGSSFILMKKGLEAYSYQQVALLRLAITGLFLLPFAIRSIRKVNLKKLGLMTIVGIVGNGIPAFLFTKAETGIDSSLAGILNSLTPLFTLIVGLLFFKTKTKWYNVLGVGIGLGGTVGLMSVFGNKSLEFNFTYGIYVIIATLLYAINLNVLKKFLKDVDAITITSYAFLTIGMPSLIYLFAQTDFITVIQTHPNALSGLGYIAILGIVGSALAVILYNKLIKTSGVLFAASVTYLMPIVAVFWGIADGERFEAVYIIWIMVILLGVFLVNYTFHKSSGKNISR
ncbi:MAG: DMT family transporter [Bacteroidota bacterium]